MRSIFSSSGPLGRTQLRCGWSYYQAPIRNLEKGHEPLQETIRYTTFFSEQEAMQLYDDSSALRKYLAISASLVYQPQDYHFENSQPQPMLIGRQPAAALPPTVPRTRLTFHFLGLVVGIAAVCFGHASVGHAIEV